MVNKGSRFADFERFCPHTCARAQQSPIAVVWEMSCTNGYSGCQSCIGGQCLREHCVWVCGRARGVWGRLSLGSALGCGVYGVGSGFRVEQRFFGCFLLVSWGGSVWGGGGGRGMGAGLKFYEVLRFA